MDFKTIVSTVAKQIRDIGYWNMNPTLIVVGERVHHTIMTSAPSWQAGTVYGGREGAVFFGIPYTIGVHVEPNYLKVLCEAPTTPSLASDCTAPSRRYDRANSPRIGEPSQPSH